jgi:hypothetical protein
LESNTSEGQSKIKTKDKKKKKSAVKKKKKIDFSQREAIEQIGIHSFIYFLILNTFFEFF